MKASGFCCTAGYEREASLPCAVMRRRVLLAWKGQSARGDSRVRRAAVQGAPTHP